MFQFFGVGGDGGLGGNGGGSGGGGGNGAGGGLGCAGIVVGGAGGSGTGGRMPIMKLKSVCGATWVGDTIAKMTTSAAHGATTTERLCL